jgi:hypothetical protein
MNVIWCRSVLGLGFFNQSRNIRVTGITMPDEGVLESIIVSVEAQMIYT